MKVDMLLDKETTFLIRYATFMSMHTHTHTDMLASTCINTYMLCLFIYVVI